MSNDEIDMEDQMADQIDRVDMEKVHLEDGALGYNIYYEGYQVGSIEAIPGKLEHIAVEMHWEGKGIGRAAVRKFVALSREHGENVVITNNAVNPAMKHILETEGFEQRSDEVGWKKEIEPADT